MKTVILDIFVKQILNKNLHESHRDLPFLPIKKEKLLTTFETKENYVIHIHYGLVLKKVHRVISFRQEAWLKTYIDKNTKLRTEAKNDFEQISLN